ncbi:hypothetical protein H5410_004645 [Solanum commersonii]|uniref:Uncharacterized protein n=1 Tax=Solanum commersonii TaxID=4109 RepID=A0A9J6B892_SOLCO|nr:hypothetical protein H5410_004645 [Solanum commersonii]
MTNETITNSESTPATLETRSSSGIKIDINHVFYLHSSNSPRMSLDENQKETYMSPLNPVDSSSFMVIMI